ncbi:MAG: hypothetical protein R3C09_12575 [Pirellulaceae bacterium]|jgi:hypothetical protein
MPKALKVVLMVIFAIAQQSGAGWADKRVLPDAIREFHSPSKNFRLVVVVEEKRTEPVVYAELYRKSDGGVEEDLIWRIDKLPHRLGPSRALVTEGGRVLLIDEWVNTPSSFALMAIEKNGTIKLTLSFADLAKLTGNSERSMAESAKFGAWRSLEPYLVPGKEIACLCTCSTPFHLDLTNGEVGLGMWSAR